MKKLSDFIDLLSPVDVIGFTDSPVSAITCRPEGIGENTLYFVVDEFLEYGHWIEGNRLLDQIRPSSCCGFVVEKRISGYDVPQLVVNDGRKALARATKFFHGDPDKKMNTIGITGTNGKTTIAHLINRLLTLTGKKSAVMGTLGVYQGFQKRFDPVYTTPLAPELFQTLSVLSLENTEAVAMEISSHALKLDRVFGLDIDVGVFTNISRDHLDFHPSMDDYLNAKLQLFTKLKREATAVVNRDEEAGRGILSQIDCPAIEYGLEKGAGLRAKDLKFFPAKTRFTLCFNDREYPVESRLPGKFNVYNLLAAFGSCAALGIDPELLVNAIPRLEGVAGRIETVKLPGNRVGVVDYAHTPDSLEKILQTLQEMNPRRIITVFGCGGDRDRGKRPLMGNIAAKYSDVCVVTSDNPRREDPLAIIEDILAAEELQTISPERLIVEADRRAAILHAFEISREGDIILVAGKGHEPYQIVGDEVLPFDDRRELEKLFDGAKPINQ